MAYVPTNWVDRVVDQDNKVIARGTPLSALNFNHIETGIAEAHASIQEIRTTTPSNSALQAVSNQVSDLKTQIDSTEDAIDALEENMQEAQGDLEQHAVSISTLQTGLQSCSAAIQSIQDSTQEALGEICIQDISFNETTKILTLTKSDESTISIPLQSQYHRVSYYDGSTLLFSELVEHGGNSAFTTTPKKEETAQFTYSFLGWSSTLDGEVEEGLQEEITENVNLYAVFEANLKSYPIEFRNYDGTLLQEVDVPYGTMPAYTESTPTIPSPSGITFNDWTPTLSLVTGPKTYSATFAYPSAWTETITDSWDEIIANCKNGTYTKYSLGATKIVDYSDEGLCRMVLVGKDLDVLSDGSGKAKLTWLPQHCLKTDRQWNFINTNEGGYPESWLHDQLENHLFYKLPKNLQEAIVSVKKSCLSTDKKDLWADCKLWVPSIRELGFDITDKESTGVTYTNPPTSPKRTATSPDTGADPWCWTRTVSTISTSGSAYARVFDSSDNHIHYFIVSHANGVAPGFCIS